MPQQIHGDKNLQPYHLNLGTLKMFNRRVYRKGPLYDANSFIGKWLGGEELHNFSLMIQSLS